MAISTPELTARLLAERGVKSHPASLSQLLIRLDFTVKKTLLASLLQGELRNFPRVLRSPNRAFIGWLATDGARGAADHQICRKS